MNWNFLIGPLVGSIIGYITNGIAIKMLFRPLRPIYLFGIKLPFTPGLIPKEKARIAKNIGQVVSQELMNEQVLSKALLKEEIYSHIKDEIENLIQKGIMSKQTLGELAGQAIGDEKLVDLTVRAEEKISEVIYQKIVSLNLGQLAVEKLVKELKGDLGSSMLGPLALFMKGSILDTIAEKVEDMINQTIEKEGEVLVKDIVDKEGKKLLEKPIREVATAVQEEEHTLSMVILSAYKNLVENKLSHALKTLDIAKIVEERVNAFDTLELERIILEVMQKELRAIIWLGALLGAIMGCIMNLI